MERSGYFSWFVGGLPKGCKLCVRGRKLVLFVTGICPRSCFYCSISDKKYHKDLCYANERPVRTTADVIAEAKINRATGAGLTGGDPLSKLDRALRFIKALKKEFGQGFHVHLYTTPESLTLQKLKALNNAGLDEIRVHPELESNKSWGKLELPSRFAWDYGLEIPAVPGLFENNIRLLKQANKWISFLNINELEIADNSVNKLNDLGFFTKSRLSYGIKGSEEAGIRLLKYCEIHFGFKVHYCTTRLKNRVQLRNRLELRASSVAERFDKITQEGTLLRGAIYPAALQPGENYKARIESLKNPRAVLAQITKLCETVGFEEWTLDKQYFRALVPRNELKAKATEIKNNGGIPVLIEEYPTYDSFIIELDVL